MSTILLAKKKVEVFFLQAQIPLEISHQREHFGVEDIIDNQYIVRIKSYFFNSTLDKEVINSVTPISIKAWHRQMDHLGNENIFCLSKAANGIDVKRLIPGKICGNCMKKKQQKKTILLTYVKA